MAEDPPQNDQKDQQAQTQQHHHWNLSGNVHTCKYFSAEKI